MKYKINEIFYSIQGEGRNTGMPAQFIRFSGCNLKCSYCDTNHKFYEEYNCEDIINELKKVKCKNVVITGGEPLLQLDEDLMRSLRMNGYNILIETNGTIINDDVLSMANWTTVSPKIKWKLKTGNELKLIYTGQEIERYLKYNFEYFYLQPCSMINIEETINKIKENPEWRLSIQTQKLLKIK